MTESAEETPGAEAERAQERIAAIEKIVLCSSVEVRTSKGTVVDVDMVDIFEIFAGILMDAEKARAAASEDESLPKTPHSEACKSPAAGAR